MLSYRHSYHAGNHGDVLKHAVVGLIASALRRKETPFFVLDTHAGVGAYDLSSATAEKTGEWRGGIGRLWGAQASPPEAQGYLEAVRAMNPDGALRYYPGSPRLLRHWLRPQDRMALFELHGSDYPLLKALFAGDRQVAVHKGDGYLGLKSMLPPKEKRGMVLIDPPYEVKSEYQQVVGALTAAVRRWPQGVYALWYPVLERAAVMRLQRGFVDSGLRRILVAELMLRPDAGAAGMYGSGMLLINPPWQLDQELERLLPWLAGHLDPQRRGRAEVRWLAGE